VCSTGKGVNTLLVTSLEDGSGFTTVLSNIIMVSIVELSEEDQRKYVALQEHVKQQFLSGAKKDRQGKATLPQDFELPAIKLNNDKVEVIITICKPNYDLSTKLFTM
jgi:hypothetical protein